MAQGADEGARDLDAPAHGDAAAHDADVLRVDPGHLPQALVAPVVDDRRPRAVVELQAQASIRAAACEAAVHHLPRVDLAHHGCGELPAGADPEGASLFP